MGSCHGAHLIGDQILGDSLDIKMLEFSRFTNSVNSVLGEIKVLKNFEFEPNLMRMSCIALDVE